MAGVPVHVISVNDYLTSRDADQMSPIYRALGLTVGCVTHDVQPQDRRAAYQCDITYCTNKDLVFDYLKDKITLGGRGDAIRLQAESLYGGKDRVNRLLLRGLHFAIVKEQKQAGWLTIYGFRYTPVDSSRIQAVGFYSCHQLKTIIS